MSEEIKPVAYLVSQEPLSSVQYVSENEPLKTDSKKITPLYTKQQLQPRVKMTQAEFDEFRAIYSQCSSVYVAIDRIFKRHKAFPFLNKKVALPGCLDDGLSNQFAKAFLNFDPEHPEETIEIITEKKWFVRRILPNTGGNMLLCFIEGKEEGLLMYNANKEHATRFDTKEEAELWTNPLTEAVLLPVGDE